MIEQVFNKSLEHYSRLAMTKGFYLYARRQVHELDEMPLLTGIRSAVAARIKDYQIPDDEKGDWDLMLSEHERRVPITGSRRSRQSKHPAAKPKPQYKTKKTATLWYEEVEIEL
jgi:hypothetical protein